MQLGLRQRGVGRRDVEPRHAILPAITGRSGTVPSPTATAALQGGHGLVGGCAVAGVNDRERPVRADRGADRRDVGQPDGRVDDVVLAAAVAAQAGDHEADRAAIHAR